MVKPNFCFFFKSRYASTMMMVSIALVSAVAVTNIYYKEKYGEQVPRWLFRLLYWNADLPCPRCKMPQRVSLKKAYLFFQFLDCLKYQFSPTL